MAGSAVATIVWSATARNIGSMIEGKTVQNNDRVVGDWSAVAAEGFCDWVRTGSSFIE